MIRTTTAVLLLVVALGLVGYTFWDVQLQYSLPTPVPQGYNPIDLGDSVQFEFAGIGDPTKPYFIHFFNPECACSRFNVKHFKSLVHQFGDDVNFIVAVVSSGQVSEEKIYKTLGADLTVLPGSHLQKVTGVYATPQAVLIDVNHRLQFRGNYNRSRYCSEKKTEYARIALEASLLKTRSSNFDQLALRAYGCRIPLCTSK